MKGIITTGRSMGMGNIFGQIILNITAIGKIIKLREKAYMNGQVK